MITKIERQQLKALMQFPNWVAIENLYNAFLKKLTEDSTVRDGEWDTVKATLIREGKIQGVTEFFQEIYKQVSNLE